LKKRIVTTLLLVSAGLLSAAMPLSAQEEASAPPGAGAAAVSAAPPGAGSPAVTADAPAPTVTASLPPGSEPAQPQTIDASDKPDPNNADGIAATVNDESISDYELRQRIALFISTSGLAPTADDQKRIRGQILDQMVDEKIRLQEAVKKKITVSPVEVDKAINSLLGQNHLTMDQLRSVLTQAGASEYALRQQITAQLAWQKTVQDEYSSRVNISPAQIDAEYQRYADGANKPHFLVNEIFLPVTNPEQDAKVLKDAQNIHDQIQAGASFGAVAHQFSQNPAAAMGGAIGEVHEGQLAPELNAALIQMKPGELSSPIRSVGGYYILNLQARQEPQGTKIAQVENRATSPDGTLPLASLLLPLGANPTKEVIQSANQYAANIHNTFNGCDNLKLLADKMKGSVYADLGNMKVTDLAPDIQKALAQTPPGETTMPVDLDVGVEIMARCDKKVVVQTAYQMPTRDQVEEILFDAQISALALRYMRDLKRDADVEVR
jgi:peptidyl-prolyl cis-trans isomerase SurA